MGIAVLNQEAFWEESEYLYLNSQPYLRNLKKTHFSKIAENVLEIFNNWRNKYLKLVNTQEHPLKDLNPGQFLGKENEGKERKTSEANPRETQKAGSENQQLWKGWILNAGELWEKTRKSCDFSCFFPELSWGTEEKARKLKEDDGNGKRKLASSKDESKIFEKEERETLSTEGDRAIYWERREREREDDGGGMWLDVYGVCGYCNFMVTAPVCSNFLLFHRENDVATPFSRDFLEF